MTGEDMMAIFNVWVVFILTLILIDLLMIIRDIRRKRGKKDV